MRPRNIALLAVIALFAFGDTAIPAERPRPIRLASLFALTGPAAPSNRLSAEGVRFAVTEINRSGGLLGRSISLLELDNASTPIGAKAAAERAADMKADAIVGPGWSSHAIAAARVAQENRIPMIANIATHPEVTRIGDYIFRVCFTDRFQGRVMARFARETLPEAARAAILVDIVSDYSLTLSDEFQRYFEALGGRVAARVPYRHTQESFETTVREAMAAEPRLLFVPGYNESGRILETAARLGLDATPFGGDGWDTDAFLENGGDRLRLGFYATHWDPGLDTPASRAFVARYRPDGPVYPAEVLAYDAVTLFADAVRRAGTLRRAKVRQALADTRGFEAVSGTIAFDRHGDPVKPAIVMKIENGRPVFLKRVDPSREHPPEAE